MKQFLVFFLFFSSFCKAQSKPIEQDSTQVEYIVIKGDSIPRKAIDLDEVKIFPKLKFQDYKARRRYLILRRKTLKVYPYAKLASERLERLTARLETLKSKRKKKKYAKRIQKYIEEEFSGELKKLTRTEGQILIKLIHRQTGHTAFTLIKELRNGWRAFWFNNTAKLFDISLKREFDPKLVEEDYLIEDILQRNFQNGRLESQKPALPFDYFELNKKWKNQSFTAKK